MGIGNQYVLLLLLLYGKTLFSSSFSYKPEEYLKGKTICVTGTIKEYQGKPEIVVDKEQQIRVN